VKGDFRHLVNFFCRDPFQEQGDNTCEKNFFSNNFCGRGVSRVVSIIGQEVVLSDLFAGVKLLGRGVLP